MKNTLNRSIIVLLAAGLPMTPVAAFNPQPEPPAETKMNKAVKPAEFDIILPNGRKQRAFIRGNQLILIGLRGGTSPAPNGRYRGPKGAIIVQKGIIVQGGRVTPGEGAQKKGLLLPAVQKVK